MNESKISVRYARALFQSALEKKLLDKVNSDMLLITSICQVAEVKEVISSPVITPSRKKGILTALLGSQVEKITVSLVELLVKNGRESFLPAVARVFSNEMLKYRGITKTELSSAVPVNEKTRKQVSALVAEVFSTKVELSETVDKTILGGFILKVNDSYIDASVRTKLRKIRKGLAAGTARKE
jgi:F-type H+-transporting ATPase subunit delta